MARPIRIGYSHAFYHVGCRRNDPRKIYKDDADRNVFLEKLQTSLEIYGIKLHTYVLMSNHFHLIVETLKANLSEFMRQAIDAEAVVNWVSRYLQVDRILRDSVHAIAAMLTKLKICPLTSDSFLLHMQIRTAR